MDMSKLEKASKIVQDLKRLDELAIEMGKKLNHINETGEFGKVVFFFERLVKEQIVDPEYTFFTAMLGRQRTPEPTHDALEINVSDVFTMELFCFIYNAVEKERARLIKKLERMYPQ
jgi:hypothetical protein